MHNVGKKLSIKLLTMKESNRGGLIKYAEYAESREETETDQSNALIMQNEGKHGGGLIKYAEYAESREETETDKSKALIMQNKESTWVG